MSIPFGIEWAPAFRELADISQIIFTVGPILLLGIFLIIKIKSKQQDEDILYKLTQLELLDSYNRKEIVKIDRKNGKACLEGIGMVERHMKKSYLNPAGGKKTIHVGIDLSNLKLVEAAKYEKATKESDKKSDKKTKQKKGAK